MQTFEGEDSTFYLTIVIKDFPGLSTRSLRLQECPKQPWICLFASSTVGVSNKGGVTTGESLGLSEF